MESVASQASLEDFKKLELRTAKILDVQEITGAENLWKLLIDTGSEKKEIVAGIKKFYPSRESLLGRCVVVVNNLTPVKIRGVESRGMLLAAKHGEELSLLTLDKELVPGSLVS